MERPIRRLAGFTLVELMVTLAVLAIIAGIAVPAFNDFVDRNRVTGAANEAVDRSNWRGWKPCAGIVK